MKERIDGYLSRKVQNYDLSALVICRYDDDGVEEWILRREGHADMGLGDGFGAAQSASIAWIRALRSKKEKETA